jgi:hypothetical protein
LIRSSPDLNWREVIDEARRISGLRILQLGLLLAHDLRPCAATRSPLDLTRIEPITQELAARVWAGLGARELVGSCREVYRFRFYMSARERMWDRIRVVRFASIRIPHPNSSLWESRPLPTWLLFLYYVIKPTRLVRRYGLRGLKGVFKPTRAF